MTFAVAYWVLMLVWLAFGIWTAWPDYKKGGGNLVLFILLVLVGWKVFGPPLHS